jgi:hypothetical protein
MKTKTYQMAHKLLFLKDGFGTDSFFRDEFYEGAEEFVGESPFFGIEVIERWNDVLVI